MKAPKIRTTLQVCKVERLYDKIRSVCFGFTRQHQMLLHFTHNGTEEQMIQKCAFTWTKTLEMIIAIIALLPMHEMMALNGSTVPSASVGFTRTAFILKERTDC